MPSLQLTDDQGRWIIPRRPIPRRTEGIAKVVEREQREVRLSSAKADAILPATLLQKKLGRSTFRLWATLLTLRNGECETHPSLPGLARMAGLTEANTRRCLERLREFKLVDDKGFTYRKVPCKCDPDLGPHMHKVYLRKVYGLLKATPDGQTQNALVPRETARLVKEATAHGGARAGAGRPKGVKDSAPRKTIKGGSGNSSVAAYKYQELISSEEPTALHQKCGVSLRVRSFSTEGAGKERKNPLRYPLPILLGTLTPSEGGSSMPNFTQPSDSAPAPALSVRRSAPEAQPAPASAWADGVEVDLFSVLGGEGGPKCITLGGGYKGPQQRYTSEDMRAASQLANEIQVLRVPAPPKVEASHGEEERLALLKAAYRAVHEKVLRTDFWRPAKAQSAKERAALLEAAQALEAENISPTAWARFSFYQWASMTKKGAPSPRWVWSAVRIHEHAGWCHEAVGTLNTAQPVPLPAVRTLMERLDTLRKRLGWGRPTSEVVSAVLPDSERKVLLAQQARQREAAQQDVERRIRSGEWMWG